MTPQPCPVCQFEVQLLKETLDQETYDCAVCGKYVLGPTLTGQREIAGAPFLSGWIRQFQETGQDPPVLTADRIKRLLADRPSRTLEDKLMLLLRAVGRRSKHPGCAVRLVFKVDYTLAMADNIDELIYYVGEIVGRGLAKEFAKTGGSRDLVLTPAGWTAIAAPDRSTLTQGFVAMSFAPALEEIWEDGFAPAIREVGFVPYRVDKDPHNQRIDAKIQAEISNSRFLVADVTDQRQGVYFEAGFAMGLGLPVFWSVKEDEINEVHFDTRQYPHILWRSAADVREELPWLLKANLGM